MVQYWVALVNKITYFVSTEQDPFTGVPWVMGGQGSEVGKRSLKWDKHKRSEGRPWNQTSPLFSKTGSANPTHHYFLLTLSASFLP